MENIGLPKSIKPRPFWVQYVSTYIVFFLSLFVCKVKVNGRKNIPEDGPFVLASNHFGYFDPFVLVHAIRKPIDFIMQKELGIEPHFLFAPMIYGAILTDRNKVGPSTIKDSLKSIKKGKILGIFPEGGITSTVLSSAKPGAIFIASKAKRPFIFRASIDSHSSVILLATLISNNSLQILSFSINNGLPLAEEIETLQVTAIIIKNFNLKISKLNVSKHFVC